MTSTFGLARPRIDLTPVLAGLGLAALTFVMFVLDLFTNGQAAFGLPNLVVLLCGHRVLRGRFMFSLALFVCAMVVAVPTIIHQLVPGPIPVGHILGRTLVVGSVWMFAVLLVQRDRARAEMLEHQDMAEDTLVKRTSELRQVNVQLHREINERRRAENRSLYLASIVESSEDAIIGQGIDGVIVSWNPGATRVYGYDREEMIGQHASILLPVEHEAEMAGFLARVARGERVEHIETVRRRSDGSLIDVSVCMSAIHDQRGEIVGASSIERDITRRKQAEEALQSLNAELEARVAERTEALAAAMSELEAFSYSVSHDLRAPLRALQGFSAALQEDCKDRLLESDVDLLDRIRSAAGRMDRIIDDLLQLSQASHRRIDQEVVDLSTLARDVAAELHAQRGQRQVRWQIAPGMDAWGDQGLLLLVVQNLLGNAFKYSRDVEEAVIEMGIEERAGGAVTYFVRDNGVGFDSQYADKLFRPFQRLHRRDEFEGSGIGLATVERVIRRHGGRIHAESSIGKGATFRFTLPAPSAVRLDAVA
ncbi:MAG TPA: PAS domain S-box protein [Candidatus Limnocylindrales bacterium]|nr:PAS domain S-box protein [Candidatus Limnocylindrales bacterium]